MTDFTLLDATGGVGVEAAKAVIAAGHPPIADKVILIDFDATIAPYGMLFAFPEPFAGAAPFSQALHANGYKIGIFTSRLSPKWLKSANQKEEDHVNYIQEYCNKYEIWYDFITAEKVPAQCYIDDKAITFNGNWTDIIVEFVTRGWL